jgi:hypothetical protein
MRTGGYAQLRSFIGTLQRDASAMIDANRLPKTLLDGDQEQNFGPDEIQFYTLTGGDTARALNHIKYTRYGNRKQWELKLGQSSATGNAQWETVGDPNGTELLDFLPNKEGQNKPVVTPQNFTVESLPNNVAPQYNRDGTSLGDNSSQRFPLYLTVDATVEQSGQLYDVGAESAGPDRVWGTKDDIRTFVE